MNVNELAQSLSGYNSTLNSAIDKVVEGVTPVAMIIIGINFLIEIDSWWRYMKQEGTGLTQELWLEVAFKYFIALFLVAFSSQLLGAMTELVNIIMNIIDKSLPNPEYDFGVDLSKVKGWFYKNVFNLVGITVSKVSEISAKLLTMMRFLQMYLLKGIAPLLVAFFMADSTRPIAINLLKHFAAAAFQGIILLLVIRIYPVIVASDILSANTSSDADLLGAAVVSIFKGIMFIFLLFGSQRIAKSLLGAM